MAKDEKGYHRATVENIKLPAQYYYRFFDKRLPDPASQFQPDGVHGGSAVINHFEFDWHDKDYQSIGLEEMIIYELHVGTFTKQGTFEAIETRIGELLETGITAIELMPVAQFPGARTGVMMAHILMRCRILMAGRRLKAPGGCLSSKGSGNNIRCCL